MQDQITNRLGASYSILPPQFSLPAMGPKLFGQAGQLAGETAWYIYASRIRIFLHLQVSDEASSFWVWIF
jgi:hypothetical protein